MKVGVSGHQKIQPKSAIGWVEATIRDELRKQRASVGVSSLAAGADQTFATIVLKMGLELEAVIPCAGYESTFTDEENEKRFQQLNECAKFHHLLDFDQPSEEAFLSAGKRVVDTSDFMIFVWDGMPARGVGGTADIVAYAQSKSVPFLWLCPRGCVSHRY